MPSLNKKRIVLCFPVETKHVTQISNSAPNSEIFCSTQQDIDTDILTADIFCGHAKEKPLPWADVVSRGRLQWIQSSAAGLDHCLTPPVISSSIPVTSAAGLFADQVAEQAMSLLFGLIRKSPIFFRAQEKREFIRRPTDDLHGKTVGIVGLGGNGRRIAECLSVMKVRIVATDVYTENKPDFVESLWPAEQLDKLLSVADVVILGIPLNEQTRGMFGQHEFASMKPDSYFVNVARGQVVVESALVEALESKQIQGAGVDVTEVEPLPVESPLWSMENVIVTPHVGAQAADRVDVTVDFFCENLRRYEAGLPLYNLVDKRLGFPSPKHHYSFAK